MITCPECGQAAADDARFCDRCGQGLAKAAAPRAEYVVGVLEPGAVLRGGEFRIVALVGRSALENRYRAERIQDGAVGERVQLRERLAPAPMAQEANAGAAAGARANDESASEDSSRPRAKTAELRRPAQPSVAQSSASQPAE